MTPSLQKTTANRWKLRAERRLKTALRPWTVDISSSYRIGDTDVPSGTAIDTMTILRRSQYATFKDVTKIDIREYKQDEETILEFVNRNISQIISEAQFVHNETSVRSIVDTVAKYIRRVSQLAITNNWTQRESRVALANYLRGQTLRIAMTEAQWAVETSRKIAVVAVNDPLKNSINAIVELFEQGRNTEARKLAREVMRLARLPLSESQGQIVNVVTESQAQLIGPEAQARAIQGMRRTANQLGSKIKEWSAVFVNTREPHAAAEGQQQNIDDHFIVGGEPLQYPGDGSLGASLWNIINCQCAAIYL